MTDEGPRCDTCKAPATTSTRDMTRKVPSPDDMWYVYKPGERHFGCAAHPPPQSVTYDEHGNVIHPPTFTQSFGESLTKAAASRAIETRDKES